MVAYVRGNGQGEAARELAGILGVSALSQMNSSPTNAATPAIHRWGDEGPPQRHEVRRHTYRDNNGVAVRIKIKRPNGEYTNWYRVFENDNSVGWQAKKPNEFANVPYTTAALDPFYPDLKDDQLFWPEGEKDVDTLSRFNLPAFTFGGVGDGLPAAIEHYLRDRHLVILADNDDPGRKHAERKATLAASAGAATIRVIHFPDLSSKGDVSDFLERRSPEDLTARVDAALQWQPSEPLGIDSLAAQENRGPDYQLVMRCMADVEPGKVQWLWPDRIAIGKQTLIGGEPGLGKSQITAALAAAVTTGGVWPCSEGRAPVGSVIILSAEDDASDTIRPRLDAAGADVHGVHLISSVGQNDGKGRRTFNLQADLALLEGAIKRLGDVRLVIIDPVSSYLGKTDSHKNADVRGILEPLSDMASRLRVAVVSVTHFSKGAQSAVNSFIGSIAFIAAARAAYIVTRDPDSDDPARRLFAQVKNNLAVDCGGLAFRVEQRIVRQDIVASAIIWESERISRTADEILAASREGGQKTERSEAEEFLRDILSSGALPATEIEAEAKEAGIAPRTLRRARKALSIKPFRKAEAGDGLGRSGRWYWSLTNDSERPKVANLSYDGHVSEVATLGNSGHLRAGGGQ